jgi:arginine decarboxylase
MNLVATKMFLTRGVGKNRERLAAYEAALRSAQIAEYNLVKISSIYPPGNWSCPGNRRWLEER